MPNLRGKTWTTTTPANVGDAQYWEDHLISDEAAQKAEGAVQSVNNTLPDENGNINITPSPLGPTVVDSLNSTSATDALSANQGHALKEEIEQIYADNGVLGAKNLLPNNATSQTINGVTFTANADGSVTANGTASSEVTLWIAGTGWTKEKAIPLPDSFEVGKTYILSGGKNSSSHNIRIEAGILKADGSDALSYSLNSWGDVNDSFIVTEDMKFIRVYIRLAVGQTANNLIFYPMLRLASDPDDTYVPYAMTNRELTEEKLSISELKTIASSAADFAAFKTAIANL